MPSGIVTLPLAADAGAGTQQTVAAYAQDKTVQVQAQGGDSIDFAGNTTDELDVLSSATYISDGVATWRTLGSDFPQLYDIYGWSGSQILSGTPFVIPWTRDTNFNPYSASPHFTLASGVFTNTRPLVIQADLQIFWEAEATGNNQDMGIQVSDVFSGAGATLGSDIQRSIFSGRSGTFPQTESTRIFAVGAEADTVQFEATELLGQSGVSTLVAALLIFTVPR